MNFQEIGIAITNYCNSKCCFCSGYGVTNKKNSEKHITVKEAIKNIEKSLNLGCKKLIITGGGEPTSRIEDVIQITKFAKSKNMETTLISNASYAKKMKKTIEITTLLKRAGMNNIILGFDSDHLLYVPYNNYLNAIRAALNNKLKVIIQVVDRISTKNENTNRLKKLSEDLNGIYKVPLFSKITKIFGIFLHEKNYIFLKDREIEVIRIKMEHIGQARTLKNEFFYKKKESLVFDGVFCSKTFVSGKGLLFFNWDGTITVGCCNSFIENLSFKNNKNFNEKLKDKEIILKKITSIFGFLKILLYIKNLESKNNKKLLEDEYTDKCNLCIDMMKVSNFKNFQEPSKIQVIIFVLPYIGSLIMRFVQDIFIIVFSKGILSKVVKKLLMI